MYTEIYFGNNITFEWKLYRYKPQKNILMKFKSEYNFRNNSHSRVLNSLTS